MFDDMWANVDMCGDMLYGEPKILWWYVVWNGIIVWYVIWNVYCNDDMVIDM